MVTKESVMSLCIGRKEVCKNLVIYGYLIGSYYTLMASG